MYKEKEEMTKVDLNDFKEQKDCTYKSELYSVRDNGAIYRHSRDNKPVRKLDNHWTFGKPTKQGYMRFASEVVHRIVACAFLGYPPTTQHIVDHKDTNRQNNRPENLRWLTKMENILKNPITVKKIEFYCGSIDAFLKDPSILSKFITEDPNFNWMRTVSAREAQNSWERLRKWSETENDNSSSIRGSLGEWIFKPFKKSEKERIEYELGNHSELSKMIEGILNKVEQETGINRKEFSLKSKKKEYLQARVYAAIRLREELDLSEEWISKIIGKSKSMVNTYLNYPDSYLKNVSYYKKK
ncbi:MAG: HNH endonuclease signature motif containing protein [Bacteroidia bacterium]|nr:HNH endonuclease signature motif containing protein [Bacteroidia bacterium]